MGEVGPAFLDIYRTFKSVMHFNINGWDVTKKP